jgi:hypothetical protein
MNDLKAVTGACLAAVASDVKLVWAALVCQAYHNKWGLLVLINGTLFKLTTFASSAVRVV